MNTGLPRLVHTICKLVCMILYLPSSQIKQSSKTQEDQGCIQTYIVMFIIRL